MGEKLPTIRYRVPTECGAPMPGHIIMGEGPRTKRGYRVLSAVASRGGLVALGCITWRLTVERISKAAAEADIEAGFPRWGIVWDSRKKGARRG